MLEQTHLLLQLRRPLRYMRAMRAISKISIKINHSNKQTLSEKKNVGADSLTAAVKATPEVHEGHEGHFENIN